MTNEEIQALQALATAAGPGDFSAGDDADPILQYAAIACQATPTLCADPLVARAEVERLRKAIGPYLEYVRQYVPSFVDLPDHYETTIGVRVTVGDLRRARAVLEGRQ